MAWAGPGDASERVCGGTRCAMRHGVQRGAARRTCAPLRRPAPSPPPSPRSDSATPRHAPAAVRGPGAVGTTDERRSSSGRRPRRQRRRRGGRSRWGARRLWRRRLGGQHAGRARVGDAEARLLHDRPQPAQRAGAHQLGLQQQQHRAQQLGPVGPAGARECTRAHAGGAADQRAGTAWALRAAGVLHGWHCGGLSAAVGSQAEPSCRAAARPHSPPAAAAAAPQIFMLGLAITLSAGEKKPSDVFAVRPCVPTRSSSTAVR